MAFKDKQSLLSKFLWKYVCYEPVSIVVNVWLIKKYYEMSCHMTKPKKWHVRPAKTQISLGIRPVWSESSLFTWRNTGPLTTYWAHSEDWSDWVDAQVDQSLLGTHHFVGFVVRRLNSLDKKQSPRSPSLLSSPLSVFDCELWQCVFLDYSFVQNIFYITDT